MDIERVMQGMGYKNAGLPQTIYKNSILHFVFTLAGVLKVPFSIKRGDNIVLQYPLKKYFSFVCKAAHLRGAKVITVIHDLGSFRRKALTPEQEIRRLNNADCIIAHNGRMKSWLEEHGCKARLYELGIFDYLSATVPSAATPRPQPYKIVYAGALNPRKNKFLYEWGAHIHSFGVRLYGNGFDKTVAKGAGRFETMGFVKSDELIATVEGHFGLVWDGSSVDACTGDWGEYLKINNPHKTSLYIRCNLPVIIWREAALASFVSENGIGICVGSLRELDNILNALTPEEYDRMKKNVCNMGKRLASGYYIEHALDKIND